MKPKGILGDTIKTARIRNNLTQEQLAEKLEISPTHLKHLESEHRFPSIDILFALADTLHFSLDSLLIPDTASDSDTQKTIQEINLLLKYCSKRELDAILAALHSLTKPE